MTAMLRSLCFSPAAAFALVALVVPLLALPAAAQDDPARTHFEAGASYYESGDYEDALREFERAYALSEEPTLFYNYSLCYQQLDEYQEAAEFLERYLNEVEAVENRPNLERRLENLRERAAQPADEVGDIDSGPGPIEPEPEPADDGLPIPLLSLVGFGVAGVGVLTTAIAGAMALAEKGSLDADPCSATRSCDATTLRRRAIFADVGLGLIVVGAALGTTFLFVGRDDDDDAAGAWLELTPYIGPSGAAAVLRGTF